MRLCLLSKLSDLSGMVHYSNYNAANRYLTNNPDGKMAEDARREVEQAGRNLKKLRIQLERDLEKYEEEGILHLSTMDALRRGYDI